MQPHSMHITFITTGGTIDKVYFDAKSAYEVGETVIEHVVAEGEAGDSRNWVDSYGFD